MMKKLTLLLCILGHVFTTIHAQNNFNCISHEHYLKQLAKDPAFKANQDALEKETEQFINHQGQNRSAAAPYIIPVVFHIIYTTAYGNIPDSQVVDQIKILNKEFNRLQADTSLTPLAFKPLAAPFNVEFRLATIDPNGNCTNGINRVYSTLSNCSLYENDIKALSYWPSNKYLNIWLTQTMHYAGSTDCGGGGYATFPGGAATLDGINIRGDLISNIGTAANNQGWGNFKGRYLIHELGHWFNLRHIWGDAVCGNDFVADTPPAQNSNSGCPSFPRNPNNSCGSGANGEMFTDYMDYTNGPCLNMFTAGQVARMTAAITSNVSGRSNLWSPANLAATGTGNPYSYPVSCVSMPDVLNSQNIIACAGDSIKLTDNSYGGSCASRFWDFGGTPASSYTDSIVKVRYNVPGVYSFTLNNTYSGVTKSKEFINKIVVMDNLPNSNYVVPFVDGFENTNSFYGEWTIVDKDNDGVTWDLNSQTYYNGFNCIGLANFGNKAPTIDEIISPAYNLVTVSNPTLSFRLHFARAIATDNDQLQVFISNNCGTTWNSVYLKSGSALKTITGTQANSYTPSVASNEWRLEKINLSPLFANGIVHFKFTFTGGGGNNIFIDDVNLDGFNTVGLKQYSGKQQIMLYPNPANDILRLGFLAEETASCDIDVEDVLGKSVLGLKQVSIHEKNSVVPVDIKNLENGVYFIHVKQNARLIYSGKFIKQSTK